MSQSDPINPHSITKSEPPITVAAGLGMIVALLATIVVAAMIVRIGWMETPAGVQNSGREITSVESPTYGVQARLKGGDVDFQKTMAMLSFSLQPGESLDPKLPAGAFEAEFIVTFDPGDVRRARIGAIIQGGSVIIHRDEALIASDAAGDEVRTVLPIMPIALAHRAQRIRYTFRANGKHPVRLQAIWQPDGLPQPVLLISNEAVVN